MWREARRSRPLLTQIHLRRSGPPQGPRDSDEIVSAKAGRPGVRFMPTVKETRLPRSREPNSGIGRTGRRPRTPRTPGCPDTWLSRRCHRTPWPGRRRDGMSTSKMAAVRGPGPASTATDGESYANLPTPGQARRRRQVKPPRTPGRLKQEPVPKPRCTGAKWSARCSNVQPGN